MLRRWTHSQLEETAENFLNKHGKFDGRRLMIEHVVQCYGYYIWPIRGLGMFAEAYVPLKAGVIFVDEEQMLEHPIRFQFTLAEELAHILIHVPFLRGKSAADLKKFFDMTPAKQYRLYEHDAKYLASCLLMRKTEFVARFRNFSAIQATKVSNRTQVLRYAIRQLSLDFAVPVAATSLRAFRLRLISEAEFIELGY